MHNGFVELRDTESLERLLAQSSAPVVIFKHSETCGISDRAYAEVSKLVSGNRSIDAPIGMVVVQRARHVSDQIEASTGVPHESPQVLIIVGRRVVWSVTHRSVKAEALRAAKQEAAGSVRKQDR